MKYVGETIVLKATFTDFQGTVTDPSLPVTCSVIEPGGNISADAVSATQQSVGVYTYNYTILNKGLHIFQFKSADGSVEESSFRARDNSND